MFHTPLQQFQFYDKYSRFSYLYNRRETWKETVDRAVEFLIELSNHKFGDQYADIRDAIYNMEVMPSMRLLAMAGEAARRTNVSIYNCSYSEVDSIDAFVESLLNSMSGCGVGYSVESRSVNLLPTVKHQTGEVSHLVIEDTTEGWASALRAGLTAWFNGEDVTFDYSLIRPMGAILRVKGGRASGPEPLKDLMNFARRTVLSAQGRKLRPLEAHDIMCKIGDASIMGGSRRTALIALFDIWDHEMANCKRPENIAGNEQRWNANNSAVWTSIMNKDETSSFMDVMFDGGVGEPGIFNRLAAEATKPAHRKSAVWGTNPCAEILLKSNEFCNLSVAVARHSDTVRSMARKVKLATLIGTIQSNATHFPGLRPAWSSNCEDERLLGVDITGQMDSPVVRNAANLSHFRDIAIAANREFANVLGINQSASVTCVKPSGNSSQLIDCSSGIHARWSPYYIRNVRVMSSSPIYKMLKDQNVPMSPENGQTSDNARTWVIHFPIAAPKGAITKNDLTAIQQCDYWKMVKLNWTTHNPSVTITYKEHEKPELADWVHENQKIIGGMSFLPHSDAKYNLAPYQEIDETEYARLAAEFPKIDFRQLYKYEDSDMTTSAQEIACVAGNCDL